ncbi:MAG: signal peptidase I [Dehalococcoidia bacterium]|nr:MAG: signal peptidase I [Dehalococcoidia bacterium]
MIKKLKLDYIACALVVLLILFMVVTVNKAGWRYDAVKTASMGRTIPVGSLVVTIPVDSATEISSGDIVAFRQEDSRILHRIIEITVENGETFYKTKGDANEDPDDMLVVRSKVEGKKIFHVPYLGYVLAKTRELMNVAGGLLALCADGETGGGNRLKAAISGGSAEFQVTTLASKLPAVRGFTSAAVASSVYVFGGYGGGYHNDIVELEPATENVTNLVSKLPTARAYTAAAASGGKIYVLGGYGGGRLNDIVEFDPATGGVVNLASKLPAARQSGAAAAAGGKVYYFGGYNENSSPCNDIIEFDPAAGTAVILTPKLPRTAVFLSAAAASSGRIYVFGGRFTDQIVEFDPATYTVTDLASKLPTARGDTSAVAFGDKIYVFGGYEAGSKFNDQIVEFNPATSTVVVLNAKLPFARCTTSAAMSADKMYVIGGYNGAYLDEIVKIY